MASTREPHFGGAGLAQGAFWGASEAPRDSFLVPRGALRRLLRRPRRCFFRASEALKSSKIAPRRPLAPPRRPLAPKVDFWAPKLDSWGLFGLLGNDFFWRNLHFCNFIFNPSHAHTDRGKQNRSAPLNYKEIKKRNRHVLELKRQRSIFF